MHENRNLCVAASVCDCVSVCLNACGSVRECLTWVSSEMEIKACVRVSERGDHSKRPREVQCHRSRP